MKGAECRKRQGTGFSVIRSALLLAVCFFCAGDAFGLYRGDEYLPRDWLYDNEYTLDTSTFHPPRRLVRRWRSAERGFIVTGGSVRPEDMYLAQHLKVRADLDAPWDFWFRFDMDEDWDGTWEHHWLVLETDIGAGWRWYGLGEPLATKEYSDIGCGFRWQRQETKLDFTFLFPNLWWNEKNLLGSVVEKRPFNTAFRGEIPAGRGLVLSWCDLDFTSVLRYDNDAFRFLFEKHRFGVEYELPAGESLFWIGISAEFCRKRRWGYVLGDVNDYYQYRDAGRAQIEYEWWFKESDALTFGFLWNYINEDEPHPNDAVSTRYLLASERLPYIAWTRKVNDRFWTRTGVYANRVDMSEDFPGNPALSTATEDWRVKVPFQLIFPGPAGELEINANWQVYPSKFGGGNVIFFVRF